MVSPIGTNVRIEGEYYDEDSEGGYDEEWTYNFRAGPGLSETARDTFYFFARTKFFFFNASNAHTLYTYNVFFQRIQRIFSMHQLYT